MKHQRQATIVVGSKDRSTTSLSRITPAVMQRGPSSTVAASQSLTIGALPATIYSNSMVTTSLDHLTSFTTTTTCVCGVSSMSNVGFAHNNPQEPLVGSSTASVYRIGALIDGGMSVAQVAEDFPSLTHRQIRSAYAYATENPNSKTSHSPKSFKRFLLGMGNS